jgi:hypothetical protein
MTMEKKPQNLQNHTKLDPVFHFFLGPVGLLLVAAASYNVAKNVDSMSAWAHLIAGLWAFIAVFKIRLYSLKVQDRVIRLEERLRMAGLLSEPLKSKCSALTEGQLIALRFASDSELPGLVEKTLASNMSAKEIKAAIQTWRPDYWRV